VSWETITQTQAERLDKYIVVYLENGRKIKYEYFDKAELVDTGYYISDESEISTWLSKNPHASFSLDASTDKYEITTILNYRNKELLYKNVIVGELGFGRLICLQLFDVNIDTPIHASTEKHFYNPDGTEKYIFEYQNDGACFLIHNVEEYQADIYPNDIGVNPNLNFTWEGFEYYQFSEPAVPSH